MKRLQRFGATGQDRVFRIIAMLEQDGLNPAMHAKNPEQFGSAVAPKSNNTCLHHAKPST
jgi:hypothetical protein